MKKFSFSFLFFMVILTTCFSTHLFAQVAVNETGSAANSKSILDVSSTTKGLLVPRMTTAERNTFASGLGTTEKSMLIYDSDLSKFYFWNGSAFIEITSGVIDKIQDANGDTEVRTAINSFGNDNIEIQIEGSDYFRFLPSRIEFLNSGNSVFIGKNAGDEDDLSNNENVFVGSFAGRYNTTGFYNVAAGYTALKNNTTGFRNTGIGYQAMLYNIGGDDNTAVGDGALFHNTDASYNTAIGASSLHYNETGTSNTTLGTYSAYNLTGGDKNTIIGVNAAFNVTTGSYNTILGVDAGRGTSAHAKSGNILIGYMAGYYETGSDKLYIENSSSSTPLIGGDFSTDEVYINGTLKISGGNPATGKFLKTDSTGNAIWDSLTLNNINNVIENDTSVFIGFQAGVYDVGATYNTGIGRKALNNNHTGLKNVGIGNEALSANISGWWNTAVGNAALTNNTAGENTGVGSYALANNLSGNSNTAIGMLASYFNQTGSENVNIGSYSNYYNYSGSQNTIIGYNSGRGTYSHTKSGNVFIGYKSGYYETGSNKLYIENSDTTAPLIGGDFAADEVYINGTVRITGGGPGSGKVLTSDASGNATWQTDNDTIAINDLTDAIYDSSSLFVGEMAGANDDGNNNNTAFGKNAFTSNTSGSRNNAIGVNALYHNSNGWDNNAFGYEALYNNSNSGLYNTAIGTGTLYNNISGKRNVAVGYQAGNYGAFNNNCIYLGYQSRNNNSSSSFLNSTALGYQSTITADNQVRIGNADVTSIGGYADWSNISDKRFKLNIIEDVKGLEFILKLRPVSYDLDVNKINSFLGIEQKDTNANTDKSKLRQTGFIAQEVEMAAKQTGFEFSGIDKPKNKNDLYGLRYAQFVVPLVKAVQEQEQKISEQQKIINNLKQRLEKLEKKMDLRGNQNPKTQKPNNK